MRHVLSLAICCIWAWANASFADIIFQAEPDTKVQVGNGDVSMQPLLGAEQREAQVVIEAQNGRYFWTTRGGVELVYRSSGIYDIFVAITGAGYIKIERSLSDGAPAYFLEHVHSGLGTITYFGTTYDYRPTMPQ